MKLVAIYVCSSCEFGAPLALGLTLFNQGEVCGRIGRLIVVTEEGGEELVTGKGLEVGLLVGEGVDEGVKLNKLVASEGA